MIIKLPKCGPLVSCVLYANCDREAESLTPNISMTYTHYLTIYSLSNYQTTVGLIPDIHDLI